MAKECWFVVIASVFVSVLVSAQQQTWISNITAAQTNSGTATITWTTAVPSDSRLYYRQAGRGYVQASSPEMMVNHSIVLTGLTTAVQYQYYVSSTDAAKLAVTSAASNYFTLSSSSWSVSPTTIAFPGNTITNTTTPEQAIAVSNPNPFGIKMSSITVSGPFAITSNYCLATGTWDGTLAPNSHCNLSVAFKPTTAGQQAGTVSLTALGTTKIVSLSGTAIAPLAISGPRAVDVTCDRIAIAQFRASGGVPPYKFGVIPGNALPVGVQAVMNVSTGVMSILWPCSVPVNGVPIDNRRQVFIAMGTEFMIHR